MFFFFFFLLLHSGSSTTKQADLNQPWNWHRIPHKNHLTATELDWKNENENEICSEVCRLQIVDNGKIQKKFHKYMEDKEISLVVFQLKFLNYTTAVMETYPYMGLSYLASQWMWASKKLGKKLLELPIDFDVLSLHLLDLKMPTLILSILDTPHKCFIMLSPRCRLLTVQRTLTQKMLSKESEEEDHDKKITGSHLCHYVFVNDDATNSSQLAHRCCSVAVSRMSEGECHVVLQNAEELWLINALIQFLAMLITLYSPVIVLKLKSFLVFEKSTKFFRASLKHGITGQRSYVIRISYRQLVNLNDSSPFSLPRSLFRLICHCYGEGRCCIHWWGAWPYQPSVCMPNSKVRKCWFLLLKIVGVLLVYPFALHLAFVLYFPKMTFYKNTLAHADASPFIYPASLSLSSIGSCLILTNHFLVSLWILFSIFAFFYTLIVVSYAENPLERCLAKSDSKKPTDHMKNFQKLFTFSHRSIIRNIAYGDNERNYRHIFTVPWIPSKMRRIIKATGRTLSAFIPLVNVCIALHPDRARVFSEYSVDENKKFCSCKQFLRVVISFLIWFAFSLVLLGYSTVVFLTAEFCLNVFFFVALACFVYPSTLFPWLYFLLSVFYYANDYLTQINFQHRYILRLIDENSPRLSAIDKSEVEDSSSVRLLKSHSLGAVKFIDGDGTEYVSKELYYGVCNNLKYGWSCCLRYFLKRLSYIVLYMTVLILCVKTLNYLLDTESFYGIIVILFGSIIPKLFEISFIYKENSKCSLERMKWSKMIPDVLDKHIKVDRAKSAIVEGEEHLSTYDVRPVGFLEMDLPRHCNFRTLELWKFPWSVSCEQQTQTNEIYVNALANRIAAASFLSCIASSSMPDNLNTEAALKSWTLMVENCIQESSSKALNLQYAPFTDTTLLFPMELQTLLVPFDAGNSVDSLVDSINRELYGFYVSGILTNINTTSCAIFRLRENKIMAFNGACHGDHVSDFFGAVLIVADFNAQNLQLVIKYLLDHHRPDTVPVYSPLAAEAYALRSSEILDLESVV